MSPFSKNRFTIDSLKNISVAGKTARWVKVLETKPGAHVVEGERQPLQAIL